MTHLFVTLAIRWRDLNLPRATYDIRRHSYLVYTKSHIYRVLCEIFFFYPLAEEVKHRIRTILKFAWVHVNISKDVTTTFLHEL